MLGDLQRAARPLAALDDELRRRLYLLVRSARRPVSRDEAAGAVRISRGLAAFHLDKLVDRGLLSARYARPPGRSGRGAGRPAKLYELSGMEIDVSIPERRYDLIGKILVSALAAEGGGGEARRASLSIAESAGRRRGRALSATARADGTDAAISPAVSGLSRCGFEPYRDATGVVRLSNCPFHALVAEAPEVVCEINRAFIAGLLGGLTGERVEARLEPSEGHCCVSLHPDPNPPASADGGSSNEEDA